MPNVGFRDASSLEGRTLAGWVSIAPSGVSTTWYRALAESCALGC